MTANIARLVYFENFVDPVAEKVLGARDDIELTQLRYAGDIDANWAALEAAHGYHIAPRGDLKKPWFGDAALLKRCANLLAICSTGAGYDMVDVEACTKAGVIVCSQSGTNKEAVAEHALGLMLSLSKKIALTDRLLRRGATVDRYVHRGNDLTGKTVGLVGIGQIGTRCAELCGNLFSMNVLAYDPYLSAKDVAARGARKVDFNELLETSDFVSVHCPRNSETLGMFGREAFARMKKSAYFITTARGGIADEQDLAVALKQGVIAGAGVDVFLEEPPPPTHPLLQLDNVIVTPHSAGVTDEALYEMAASAAAQWITLLTGGVPPRLVNPEAWPLYRSRFKERIGKEPSPLLS